VYFGKLVFNSDKQEFSLSGVKSKKISSHPGRDLLKIILKVRKEMLESELSGLKEKTAECHLHKIMVERKGRDESSERGSVHDEK